MRGAVRDPGRVCGLRAGKQHADTRFRTWPAVGLGRLGGIPVQSWPAGSLVRTLLAKMAAAAGWSGLFYSLLTTPGLCLQLAGNFLPDHGNQD